MFLALTADQRYWKKQSPLLFLGDWCRLYAQRSQWSKIPHEVIPYHWDDRNKLYQDYKYLQQLYERLLAELAGQMNLIHAEDKPLRYWRMIVGPWLSFFIQVLFDRYSCIEQAVQTKKVDACWIGNFQKQDWVPDDYEQFVSWVLEDAYNLFLYSRIIEFKDLFGFVKKDIDLDTQHSQAKKAVPRKFARQLVDLYERLLPHRFNKFVFVSSYLPKLDQCRLQLSLGQCPSFFSPAIPMPCLTFNQSLRDRLCLKPTGNAFEDFLCTMIPEQIPKVYMEAYALFKQKALAAYPQRPQTIITANDFYANEGFKIFAANATQEGAKLLGIQHGGVYGSSLFFSGEEHERDVSDIFYTWGWEEEKKTKPMAATKLNRFTKGLAGNPQGKVLMICGTVPRYAYSLYSIFLASSGMSAYFQDIISFIQTLDTPQQQELLVRTDKHDYHLSQRERIEDIFPKIAFDQQASIIESLKKSRLAVVTYNATAYLETFTANFPTIIFWNPKHWELREEAKIYFERLKKAGILHDTPQSAAQKVNAVYADPQAWWMSAEVQDAKNFFCSRFALTSDNWLLEWRRELLAQAN